MLKVKIINRSSHPLPGYQTPLSAGMDLRAFLTADSTYGSNQLILPPFERVLVPTGLFMELPAGFEAQIRPRSGLALKHGITVLNSPGTIDADYRGEIKVLLVNLSKDSFTINDGDRIAQMIISKHETVEWEETTSLEESQRGQGGYGHTGI